MYYGAGGGRGSRAIRADRKFPGGDESPPYGGGGRKFGAVVGQGLDPAGMPCRGPGRCRSYPMAPLAVGAAYTPPGHFSVAAALPGGHGVAVIPVPSAPGGGCPAGSRPRPTGAGRNRSPPARNQPRRESPCGAGLMRVSLALSLQKGAAAALRRRDDYRMGTSHSRS